MASVDPSGHAGPTAKVKRVRRPGDSDVAAADNRFFVEDFIGDKLACYPGDGRCRASWRRRAGLAHGDARAATARLATPTRRPAGSNMHLYWTGVAADLLAEQASSRSSGCCRGRSSGEVYAGSVHAEKGNDVPRRRCGRHEAEPGSRAGSASPAGHVGSLTPGGLPRPPRGGARVDPAAPRSPRVRPRNTGLQHQGHVGRPRHARHREPRSRVLEGAACPTGTRPGWCRRRSRAPILRPGHLPVGAHRLRQCLLLPARHGRCRWRACEKKTSLGISRGSMAYHPRWSQRRQEAMGSRRWPIPRPAGARLDNFDAAWPAAQDRARRRR